MTTNGRKKGKRVELEWCHILKAKGFAARRGQQFKGSPDSPDVICDDLDHMLHQEVKGRASTPQTVYKWLEQAGQDAGEEQYPIVAAKRNYKPWVVWMYGEDFLNLLQQLMDLRGKCTWTHDEDGVVHTECSKRPVGYSEGPHCPHCGGIIDMEE